MLLQFIPDSMLPSKLDDRTSHFGSFMRIHAWMNFLINPFFDRLVLDSTRRRCNPGHEETVDQKCFEVVGVGRPLVEAGS